MDAFERKIKVICPLPWSHHHSGWPFVVAGLYTHLHVDYGIPLLTNGMVGEILEQGVVHTEPWLGVLHATPTAKLADQFKNVPASQESLKHCLGIYALSDYVRDFVIQTTGLPSETMRLAISTPRKLFDVSRKPKSIIMVGHWLRRFETFYDLDAGGYHKAVLQCTNIAHPPGIDVMPYQEAVEYENLLATSIVFLDLIDASANNIVVECIARNTPIIINRLPAVVEYLGEGYPLYYDTKEEAEGKLKNYDLIVAAHDYLQALDKTPYSIRHLINTLAFGEIYRNLKVSKPVKLF